jgi:hypothetical protein
MDVDLSYMSRSIYCTTLFVIKIQEPAEIISVAPNIGKYEFG